METNAQVVKRMVWQVLVADVVIALVTAVIVFVTQAFSIFQYGVTLFIVGGLCAALGALSTVGGFSNRGDWRYQFGRSVSVADIPERTQQEVTERTAREGFVVIVAIAGALAMLGGFVLQSLR